MNARRHDAAKRVAYALDAVDIAALDAGQLELLAAVLESFPATSADPRHGLRLLTPLPQDLDT